MTFYVFITRFAFYAMPLDAKRSVTYYSTTPAARLFYMPRLHAMSLPRHIRHAHERVYLFPG